MSTEELCPARYLGLVSGGRECRLPVGHRLGPHVTSDGHTWTDEDMARWRRAGLLPATDNDEESQ